MMGALAPVMTVRNLLQLPPRLRRLGLVGLSLLAGLSLGGCSGLPRPPQMVFMSIGVNDDETIDTHTLNELRLRLKLLESGFRALHPGTFFQFNLAPEHQIESVLRQRTQTALAPDLAFVNGDTAVSLLDEGVVDPYPITPQQQHLFDPLMLSRLRDSRGRLAGLPVMVRTQLTCFNRKHLPKPPTTTDGLLQLSGKGPSIGLTLEPVQLIWSAGSLGALDGIDRAAAGQPLSAAQRSQRSIELRWLVTANNQEQITFYATQPLAMAEFEAGRLDWIICDSSSLSSLAKTLGNQLGVSPLPAGPGGPASPINRLRVVVLGRSSTPSGRQLALAFSGSSVNAESQSSLTMGSQSVLPANRFVEVPVQSSERLAALVRSARAGTRTATLARLLHSRDQRLVQVRSVLMELIFGDLPVKQASDRLIASLHPQP